MISSDLIKTLYDRNPQIITINREYDGRNYVLIRIKQDDNFNKIKRRHRKIKYG